MRHSSCSKYIGEVRDGRFTESTRIDAQAVWLARLGRLVIEEAATTCTRENTAAGSREQSRAMLRLQKARTWRRGSPYRKI